MKKLISALISITMMMSVVATAAFAVHDEISVVLDGQKIQFDVPPEIINDRTMVPLRAIFEALGATVEWDGNTHTVTSTKGDREVKMRIGIAQITINGSSKALDVAPCVINDRTLVPVRAISEAFDMSVKWDGSTKTVKISSGAVATGSSAYEKLKNVIIENGIYVEENDGYIMYFVNEEFASEFAMQYDDSLAIHYENYGSELEDSLTISVQEDGSSVFYYSFYLLSESKDEIIGELHADKDFSVLSSTIPTEHEGSVRELINTTIELMDTMTELYSGVTFGDLGIYYPQY